MSYMMYLTEYKRINSWEVLHCNFCTVERSTSDPISPVRLLPLLLLPQPVWAAAAAVLRVDPVSSSRPSLRPSQASSSFATKSSPPPVADPPTPLHQTKLPHQRDLFGVVGHGVGLWGLRLKHPRRYSPLHDNNWGSIRSIS